MIHHPTAKVPEQVNRTGPPRNTIHYARVMHMQITWYCLYVTF